MLLRITEERLGEVTVVHVMVVWSVRAWRS